MAHNLLVYSRTDNIAPTPMNKHALVQMSLLRHDY
jgi:hypothetical protein